MNRITFRTEGVSEGQVLVYQNVIRDAIDAARLADERWAVSVRAVTDTPVLIFEFRRESDLPGRFTFQVQEDAEGQLFRVVTRFLASAWPDGARQVM